MWIALWVVTVALAIWQLILTIWLGRLYASRPCPRELVNLQIVFNNLIREFQETADGRIAELDARLRLVKRRRESSPKPSELLGAGRLVEQWRGEDAGQRFRGLEGQRVFEGRRSGLHPVVGRENVAK